jgi:hypothetical protein
MGWEWEGKGEGFRLGRWRLGVWFIWGESGVFFELLVRVKAACEIIGWNSGLDGKSGYV